MFSDDRFMTLATGLVLAIVVGTLVQKSDSVMAFFGSADSKVTESDQFTVRAGRDQNLDVLANDTLGGTVVISTPPTCGTTTTNPDGSIGYSDSGSCEGQVTFAYCVENGDVCKETEVTLSVINSGTSVPVVAEAKPADATTAANSPASAGSTSGVSSSSSTDAAPLVVASVPQANDRLVPKQILVQNDTGDTAVVGFGNANAPTLFAPDMQELIQPQETVDTLRRSVAAVAPSKISQDSNITAQSSAAMSSQVGISGQSLQAAASAVSDSAPVIAFASPSRPAYGSAPALAPAQQANTRVVRAPDVVATVPAGFTLANTTTQNDPVSITDSTDRVAKLVASVAPSAQNPATPPENVDTRSADAGKVPVSAAGLSDSADVVVEMAAQIILPDAQLVQSVDRSEAVTPEVAQLLSDKNFTADLAPSQPPESQNVQVASLPASDTVTSIPASPEAALTCDVQMNTTARPGAEISIFVSSPCHAGKIVTITHSGLSFTAYMDDKGIYSADVPALTEMAAVEASFKDGKSAQAQVQVRDAGSVERVAIVWSVPVSIGLHAYENGAKGNEGGHVWAGNPRKYRDTLIGGGGFIQTLGDPAVVGGSLAEVYSLPTNRLRRQTTVRMDLSIDDATQYCGRTMLLKTIRTQKNNKPTVRSFNLALPDCATAANGVVLQNFIDAISVARR